MIKAKANHFNKLCVLAGHALVFSWYQTMADALYANDLVKVMQLYEAGMTAIIRLRLTTSHTQVLTDAHTWSEVARASSHAGSSDFFDFVKRLSTIPDVVRWKGQGDGTVENILKEFGDSVQCQTGGQDLGHGNQ